MTTTTTTTTTTTIYDNNILSNTYPVSDLVHYRSQGIGRNTGIKDNHGEAPQAHSSTDEQKVSLFFCEVKAGRGYPSVEQPLAQAIFFFLRRVAYSCMSSCKELRSSKGSCSSSSDNEWNEHEF